MNVIWVEMLSIGDATPTYFALLARRRFSRCFGGPTAVLVCGGARARVFWFDYSLVLGSHAMSSRWVLLFLIGLTLAACGSAGDSGGSSSSGSEDGSKWRVEYSGDLNGEVSGSIMSIVSVASNTTIAGGAMNEDFTGSADHSFRATIMRYGDEPSVSFSLELADGMRCSVVRQQDSQPPTVEIFDESKDTFRAEIRGTLHCGAEKAQQIEFTAYLNADA
jgi:hypothetical protein